LYTGKAKRPYRDWTLNPGARLSKSLVQQGFPPIFTIRPESAETCNLERRREAIAKSTVKKVAAKKPVFTCTKSCHPPVNQLHSIENK